MARNDKPSSGCLLWEDTTPNVDVSRVHVEPTQAGVWVHLYHGEQDVNRGWAELWLSPEMLRRILSAHLGSPNWRMSRS